MPLYTVPDLETAENKIPQSLGNIYYVSKDGDDGNRGDSPERAFLTINRAINDLEEGDEIRIKAGSYVENVDLDVNSCRLIGSIGTSLIGTLLISANTCSAENFVVISMSTATPITLTGSGIRLNRTPAMGGTCLIGIDVQGTRCTLVDCTTGGYDSIGFKSSGEANTFDKCRARGEGSTATTGFYFADGANSNICKECTSSINSTNSFYTEEEVEDTLFIDCHSGLNDGGRSPYFGNSMWSGFQYESKKHRSMELNGNDGGSGTTYIYTNLFKITGTVRVLNIRGVIAEDMSSSIEDLYLELHSANRNENITLKVGGRDLDNKIAGGVLELNNRASVKIDFISAEGCNVDSTSREQYYQVMCVSDKTGGVQVDTYIRCGYKTTNNPAAGKICWHVEWEQLSPDGFLSVA